MVKYKILDHTADAALEVFGDNIDELFVNAAQGMFSLITDKKTIRLKDEFRINLKAVNPEELINKWLNELLFIFETEKVLFKKFNVKIKIEKDHSYTLSGLAKGEKYCPDHHLILAEIKMATFHQLNIKKLKNLYTTKIVLDL